MKIIKKNHLTIEHIPQETLGGKPLLLTCKKCNNDTGHTLDSKLLEHYKLLLPADVTIDTKVTINNTLRSSAGMKVNLEENLFEFILNIKDGYRLDVLDNFKKENKDFHADFRFSVPNERFVKIAKLKIAYLLVFQKFGHSFILNHTYNLVRKQIKKPEQEILPSYGVISSVNLPFKEEGIFLLIRPERLKGLIVNFKIRLENQFEMVSVLLPLPNSNCLEYFVSFKQLFTKGEIITFERRFFKDLDFINDEKLITTLYHDFK